MKMIRIFLLLIILMLPQKAFGILQDSQETFKETLKAQELLFAGKHNEALNFAKDSLDKKEKSLGKEHPDLVGNLYNLGSLYSQMGKYAEAEPILKRAIEIGGKTTSKSQFKTLVFLELGQIYRFTGRYAEAELSYKSLENPDTAESYLAQLYQEIGRYDEAEVLHRRALIKAEKMLGKGNITEVVPLNFLATIYQAKGRYTEAESLYKRALESSYKAELQLKAFQNIEIDDKSLQPFLSEIKSAIEIVKIMTPLLPSIINYNLSSLYQITGRYNEAEVLNKKALETWDRILGWENPYTASGIFNLASLYAATERQNESHQMFVKGMSIEDRRREESFLLLSERQKLNYIKLKEKYLHAYIYHTSRYLPANSSAVTDTFNAWLRWKGAVIEAQGRYLEALTRSDDPKTKELFENLTALRRTLAHLYHSGPSQMPQEEYKRRLQELEKKKESAEAELNRLSQNFSLDNRAGKADIFAIAKRLPPNSVYLDFAKIPIFNFQENKAASSYRYLVFVLLPEKEPIIKLLELADAKEIDRHINTYLDEMRKVETRGRLPSADILREEAKSIYQLVIKPLETYLHGKKELYISPDGNLHLIPFEVLINPQGKYLMEDYQINYLAAGRDIIRFEDSTPAAPEALIFADPDYDLTYREKEQEVKLMKSVEVAEAKIRGTVSREAGSMRFSRLPETKQEADTIAKLLEKNYRLKVKNYQDKRALEEILYTAQSPQILHLATHGHFLNDEQAKPMSGAALTMGGVMPTLGDMTGAAMTLNIADTGQENPMLRSWVVLAGANTSLQEGRDDGIVSADKILGLNLKGTELVVLSACKTGVGAVASGEGVFGLKRAFILTGAKTVIMSLWSVPSQETTDLMTDFYNFMTQGKTKAEALREAKYKMMKKKSHPFYWGAFVMVGKPN